MTQALMTGASNSTRPAVAAAMARVCTIVMLALLAGAGLAQETQPPAATPPSPPAQMPRPFEPGFLQAIGRWFERSSEDLNTRAKTARDNAQGALDDMGEKAKAAAAAAKEAAEKLAKLPGSRVIDGRERCELAPNGFADCRAAAETICRAKGFTSGKSLDTQQAEKCPARS